MEGGQNGAANMQQSQCKHIYGYLWRVRPKNDKLQWMGVAETKLNVTVEVKEQSFECDIAQAYPGGEPVSL